MVKPGTHVSANASVFDLPGQSKKRSWSAMWKKDHGRDSMYGVVLAPSTPAFAHGPTYSDP